MQYRKEIDGLRAIAVIPVILFHAGFEKFSGGFVGVDIFFVISGYLITTIILSEKEQGIFSLVNFYERRARRIIPALFVVMFVSILFSWFLLPPLHMKDFSESLVAVLIFSSNILFWQETGYWGVENELKPLLHTWSLAVEEQYYVLFPLFLMLMWRFKKRWILGSFFIVAILSLALSHWAAFTKPTANFFLLPTRGWELAIGAGIAFYFVYRKKIIKSLLSHRGLDEILGWVGLSMITYSVFMFNEKTPFPSLYALLPTIGTAFIIIFSSNETSLGKLLGSKIFVVIGLISYSAYLWHQPLFVFARHIYLDPPPKLIFLVLSAISLLLAYISWKYIEAPFRKRGTFSRKQIFSFTAFGSVLFLTFGVLGHFSHGFPDRYPLELKNIANLTLNKVNADRNHLRNQLCKTKIKDVICGTISDDKLNVLVVGDSHGPDGVNIFAKAFPKVNILVAEKGGCPLIHDLVGVTYSYKQCSSFNKIRFSAIQQISESIDFVVLSQRMSFPRIKGTKKTIHWLHDIGLPPIVLGAGPWYKRAPSSLILHYKSFEGIDEKLSKHAIKKHYAVDEKIEPLVNSLGGYYIRKIDYFCPNGICRNILPDGNPLLFDKHHLTLSAANIFAEKLREDKDLIEKMMKSK